MVSQNKWINVKRGFPCPICQHSDWCSVTADGKLTLCHRVPSDRPCTGKMGGWFHRLGGARAMPPPRAAPKSQRTTEPFGALLATWRHQRTTQMTFGLACRLGVFRSSIESLMFCYAPEHKAWAIPMYDADMEIIGIRLRAESGFKWAVEGGHNGVFTPSSGISCGGISGSPYMVCEGPTTAAALLTLGYQDVIGRASCGTCVDIIKEIVSRDRRGVVIMADRDEPKPLKNRPGGFFLPGQEGAEKLAGELTRLVPWTKIVYPLEGKDARDWLKAGATRGEVDAVISNTEDFRA